MQDANKERHYISMHLDWNLCENIKKKKKFLGMHNKQVYSWSRMNKIHDKSEIILIVVASEHNGKTILSIRQTDIIICHKNPLVTAQYNIKEYHGKRTHCQFSLLLFS